MPMAGGKKYPYKKATKKKKKKGSYLSLKATVLFPPVKSIKYAMVADQRV